MKKETINNAISTVCVVGKTVENVAVGITADVVAVKIMKAKAPLKVKIPAALAAEVVGNVVTFGNSAMWDMTKTKWTDLVNTIAMIRNGEDEEKVEIEVVEENSQE